MGLTTPLSLCQVGAARAELICGGRMGGKKSGKVLVTEDEAGPQGAGVKVPAFYDLLRFSNRGPSLALDSRHWEGSRRQGLTAPHAKPPGWFRDSEARALKTDPADTLATKAQL